MLLATQKPPDPQIARTFSCHSQLLTFHSNAGGRLIGVGVFAHVYDLGDGRVRKVASPNPNHPDLTLNSIRREREIYKHLGDHPRVIKCLATGDLFVELEYASRGHVESYLKSHDTTEECRIRFAHEMIEAVVFIHSRGVIHSDLAARQFLLDSTLHVHLSDFGFSSFSDGDVLGFENASHHLPRDIDSDVASTIQSDLFALGSTLYEVMAGKPPYEGKSDDVITQLYSSGSFPCVEGILCGDIIMGCWQGQLKSSTEVLQIFTLQFSVTTI